MLKPPLQQSAGLLRSPVFDSAFIGGIAVVAMAAGLFVHNYPAFFWSVLALDLWLLGYHHVVATYTRLVFDTESFKEHRHLVLYVPGIVAVAVTAAAVAGGLWPLVTAYLYWQWFHYTRQSEGVSKAYAAKASDKDLGDRRVARLAFYAVPVAGILHVSARDPGLFLSMSVKTLAVPDAVLAMVDVIALSSFLAWCYFQWRAWSRGRLAVAHFYYCMSHFAVFSLGYLVLPDFDHGWLTVNIWHNAQYILFVWLFNNRRFRGVVDSRRVFLSTICQDGRFPLYIAVCLTVSTTVYFLIQYFGVDLIGASIGVSVSAAAVIIYQTINFHHYIVDAVIWKLRKPSLRANLGLT
jgi:hypothetical protein